MESKTSWLDDHYGALLIMAALLALAWAEWLFGPDVVGKLLQLGRAAING